MLSWGVVELLSWEGPGGVRSESLTQLPHGSLENPTIEGFLFKTRHYGISVLEKKTFRGFMGSSGIWSFW